VTGVPRNGYIPIQIEIGIELFYNMYRMNRLLSLGPPNNAIQETYKLGLYRYPPKSNLSKGWRGFLLPPPRGSVLCVVVAAWSSGRAYVQCAEARRVVVRDSMRYMSRRLCIH
jgi:hypothetical protein